VKRDVHLFVHGLSIIRASPTVLQFSFCKTRSLPNLKSICQVTKLSVSNGFDKIELAKPNAWPQAWEGRRAALNSWPQAARFSDYGSGRRHVRRCFCREAVARVDFVSRSGQQRVWRGFFARRTTARGETLCRERSRRPIGTLCRDRSFPIWREEESETRGRPETAREERPIGLCQVVRGWTKMPSFLSHLPTLPKCKTQMQNHWISQFELFDKLVKCKLQLQNRWRCSYDDETANVFNEPSLSQCWANWQPTSG